MPDHAAPTTADPPAGTPAGGRTGRRRDHTRDAAILDAALEVLGEVGYTVMTMDMVAARAHAGKATLYRRWSSKTDLVLDAVTRLRAAEADPAQYPDTGTLRDDLVALTAPTAPGAIPGRALVMRGVSTLLAAEPELARAAGDVIVEPWTRAMTALIGRAVDRGEIRPPADIDAIASVAPSMGAYRFLVAGQGIDRDYLIGLIDTVVLPALGIGPTGTRS